MSNSSQPEQTYTPSGPASPSAANRPSANRSAAEAQPMGQPVERRRGMDRRQEDRRGMDRLRAEALQNVISMVEDRNFGGLRNRLQAGGRRRGLPTSRILLLVIALLAGGLAAWLTVQQPGGPAPVAAPETVEAPPMAQVLVAREAIAAGQHLTADRLEWIDWPESAVRPDYITDAQMPDAPADMSGQVARAAFYPGEPIRDAKLSDGDTGYLAAILPPGTRGVSVIVQAASSSGGFIVPKDRVDVVLTRSIGGTQNSQTILSDVEVMALNGRFDNEASGDGAEGSGGKGADSSESFEDQAIAILALDPVEARIIINAAGMGALSLMLRPAADAASPAAPDAASTANATIRMSSPFWTSPESGSR
jgi:pilus assembly protein CpaB